MSMVRFASFAFMAGGLALVVVAWGCWAPGANAAETPLAPQPFATALAHVGRDPLTGMPMSVGDRFIAEQEEERDRYGKDERDPVPAPAVEGAEIAGIAIPSIGVDAVTARFGLDAFGRLDVPQDDSTVGWHPAYSALPGEGGATFLAAHYEYAGRPGIFHGLSSLSPQAEVLVALSDGSIHRYTVVSVVDYDLGVIDMGAILQGHEGAESLTLMTCSGSYSDGTYNLRTVVLAVRADE